MNVHSRLKYRSFAISVTLLSLMTPCRVTVIINWLNMHWWFFSCSYYQAATKPCFMIRQLGISFPKGKIHLHIKEGGKAHYNESPRLMTNKTISLYVGKTNQQCNVVERIERALHVKSLSSEQCCSIKFLWCWLQSLNSWDTHHEYLHMFHFLCWRHPIIWL